MVGTTTFATRMPLELRRTAILVLRNYVRRSALRSPREEEELRTRSESAARELRALVGTVGGVDLVDTAMRLHRDERSVMDNAMLTPDETFWTIAQLRARRSGWCGRPSRLSPSSDGGGSRSPPDWPARALDRPRRVWAQTLFLCPNPRESGRIWRHQRGSRARCLTQNPCKMAYVGVAETPRALLCKQEVTGSIPVGSTGKAEQTSLSWFAG